MSYFKVIYINRLDGDAHPFNNGSRVPLVDLQTYLARQYYNAPDTCRERTTIKLDVGKHYYSGDMHIDGNVTIEGATEGITSFEVEELLSPVCIKHTGGQGYWIKNEYAGKFAQISGEDELYPIIGNTDITLAIAWTPWPYGNDPAISIKPGAHIEIVALRSELAAVKKECCRLFPSGYGDLVLKNIHFRNPINCVNAYAGSPVYIKSCKFSNGHFACYSGPGQHIDVRNTVFENCSAPIFTEGTAHVNNVFFDGCNFGIEADYGGFARVQSFFFARNTPNPIIVDRGSKFWWQGQGVWLEGCDHWVRLQGGFSRFVDDGRVTFMRGDPKKAFVKDQTGQILLKNPFGSVVKDSILRS